MSVSEEVARTTVSESRKFCAATLFTSPWSRVTFEGAMSPHLGTLMQAISPPVVTWERLCAG
jgi:hypothetical protein